MPTQLTRTDIRILDPETYANGNPETFGLPLDQYAYAREDMPCYLQEFSDPLLMDKCWVFTRHQDCWDMDRDSETFAANRGFLCTWRVMNIDPIEYPGGKPALLTMDGDVHRRNRGVVSRWFTPNALSGLEDTFRTYARTVIDNALAIDAPFDFVKVIAHEMPMQALGDVLGVPEADRPKFFGWVDTFAAPFDPRVSRSLEELEAAIQHLLNYALELVEMRRRDPGDDVMTYIAKAADEGLMSEDEVMGNVSLLANGAAESTRTTLSHGIHELMRNPEQMQWLRERADDIPPTAIQELVRIASPFTHFVRTATRDVEAHGQLIKEGERVCMVFAAANFDPEAFDAPEQLNLARDPNPHMSFGRGRHACLGKHVAALEMKILLEELLQRTSDIQPAGEISYVRDNFSRSVYSLPVTLTAA